MSNPILHLSGVTKDYWLGKVKVPALRGIDLEIGKGEFMSIKGPSGSGKTTLLNIIGLIDNATGGSVLLDGKDVTRETDKNMTRLRLTKIGFIFQTFNLIPVFNVIENVEFPLLLLKDRTPAERRRKTMELIDAVGLRPYVHHRPNELSGGQRQRVAIARALVTDPEIILADEPTANLDSVTGKSILEAMKEMNERRQTTFIFSTHDAGVLQYARRIVEIHDGLLTSRG
ncbi:MAG: ABC transporter ATP-binding protein [Spirochaetes bacterium]|nr:ABC transporter ATP-binding protein [Spirochaetota bacterium]